MIGVVGQLVSGALGALQSLGYPGIAALVGLESAGLPLPGETTLLAASYLAATGHLSLPLVIGSAALGAIVGDSVGYFVGRRGGRRLLERRGKWLGVTPEKLAKADRYFARHGAKTVFFGRFVALLRILAGPLAGGSKMPYRRFLAANVAGALTWATTMGNTGVLLRQAGRGVPELAGRLDARRHRGLPAGALRLRALAAGQGEASYGVQGRTAGGRDAEVVGRAKLSVAREEIIGDPRRLARPQGAGGLGHGRMPDPA